MLDSTRCISYLTIEQRGPIPDQYSVAIGSRVYGCDVCQDVCPWNQRAPASSDAAWQPRPLWHNAEVVTLWQKSDQELASAMHASAMRRAKVAGLRRNLGVAMKNRPAGRVLVDPV